MDTMAAFAVQALLSSCSISSIAKRIKALSQQRYDWLYWSPRWLHNYVHDIVHCLKMLNNSNCTHSFNEQQIPADVNIFYCPFIFGQELSILNEILFPQAHGVGTHNEKCLSVCLNTKPPTIFIFSNPNPNVKSASGLLTAKSVLAFPLYPGFGDNLRSPGLTQWSLKVTKHFISNLSFEKTGGAGWSQNLST